MATETIVTLVDSLNGSTEDVETVTFFHPMTGQKMEIELDSKNRKAMGTHLERMNKYFEAAVPVQVPVESKPKAANDGENAKVRAWAKENGFPVGDRGRISAEIRAAYTAAHEQVKTEPVETSTQSEDTPEVTNTESEQTAVSEDDVLELLKQMDNSGEEITEESVKAALAESASQE